MPTRVCIDCGHDAPLTTAHYRRKKSGEWDTRCLVCRAKVNRGKKAKQKERDTKAIEASALRQFTQAAQRGGANIPHSSELLERLMEYFGGTSGFAAMMVKQYFDAPPGGAHRTKLLEGIVRLVTKNTELGGAKKPLTQWSDAELESELDKRLSSIALSMQGAFINVQVAPQTPQDFAAAVGQSLGHIPAERVEGDAGGTGEPPHRSTALIPTDEPAGGSPSVQGE
jgi:hypothetical protein